MLEPGTRFGNFTIEGQLGEGGMGAVYRAIDARLGRHVALKVVRTGHDGGAPHTPGPAGGAPPGIEGTDAAARLVREARAAALLSHPNVIAIYEVGEVDGAPFIAMELIEGRALRAFVGDASIGLDRKLRWLGDVARALDAAHRAGIVHRDVKPDNVIVRAADDAIKVLDFGIARAPQAPLSATATTAPAVVPTLTAEGVAMGTPLYMAPEQIRGEPLDGRTDQFAWGVLAHELLSGRAPWRLDRDTLALVASILGDEPPPLPADVPPHVAATVMRALAKRPGDRFASMAEVLDAITAPPAPEPAPSPPAKHETPPPPRRDGRRSLLIGAALALGIAGAWLVIPKKDVPPAPGPAPTATPRPRAMLSAPAPRSSNAEALAAYRAGLQAWHDGHSLTVAREQLVRAGTLDPSLAAAHVRAAYLSFRYAPADGRELLEKARQMRASLDDHDRALLEATVPLLAEPSNLPDFARKLRAALERFPDDEELMMMLLTAEFVRYDHRRAGEVADRLFALDPTNGEAAWTRAFTRWLAGDPAGARKAFDACLETIPGSGGCLWNRMILDEAEGRCPAVLAGARAWTASAPSDPQPYYWMAKAHAAMGAYAAAREALAQRWQRIPEAGRRPAELADRARLAVLEGDLAEAERYARDHQRAIAAAVQLSTHRDAALLLGLVLEETDQKRAAAEVASGLIARQGAWTSSTVYVPLLDATVSLSAIVARAGQIGGDEIANLRKKAADDGLRWFLDQEAPREVWAGRVWLHSYGISAETEAEANAAIAALPAYEPRPLPDALSARDLLLLARTWGQAKRWDVARPMVEAAARSCAALDYPIWATRVALALGEAREHAGDKAGACEAYGTVIARWGAAKKSVTAAQAKQRAAALGCAKPSR